jgi:hypothetical protein
MQEGTLTLPLEMAERGRAAPACGASPERGDAVTAETTGAKGRGRWRFSGLRDELLSGRPAELEFCGDMREWLTMTEIDRWSELFRLAHDKLDSVARDGLEPPRQARTSLGFGLLGPWAPQPVRTGEFRLALPDGSEFDVHGEAATDGEWILYLPGGPTARMSSAPRST